MLSNVGAKILAGPLMASFMMALARWHIDRVFLKIDELLCASSAELERPADERGLGELLVFCRASSERAVRLYGVPMDWMSIARFLLYIGNLTLLLFTFLNQFEFAPSRYSIVPVSLFVSIVSNTACS